MIESRYDTVPNYLTVGDYIVKAVPVSDDRVALTGLLVKMPESEFRNLDTLEAGYDRVKVVTTMGIEAYMYVQPQSKLKNYSTYGRVAYGS